jgi:hypothetical protein
VTTYLATADALPGQRWGRYGDLYAWMWDVLDLPHPLCITALALIAVERELGDQAFTADACDACRGVVAARWRERPKQEVTP